VNNHEHSSESQRLDTLTGVGNQRSFFDWLFSTQKKGSHTPFTLIEIDVNNFKGLNDTYGHRAGDEALKWISDIMVEETRAPVYRIGGDEFVSVLIGSDQASNYARAKKLFERLNREGDNVHLMNPAADMAVIHYRTGQDLSSGDVMGELYAAIYELKTTYSESIRVFNTGEIRPAQKFIREMAFQLEKFAKELDESHQLAFTDPISGLPNTRAAMQELELTLAKSKRTKQPFAILLIDGDDLARYNEISYSAGDEMIRNLGATQSGQLRAGDFLARWRMGDEFLVIMPLISIDEARLVGERIRSAVEHESLSWPLPVTISAGLAAYPDHGKTLSDLLYHAEAAKDKAKLMGKNNIVFDL